MAHSALEYARARYKHVTEQSDHTPEEKKLAEFYLREEYSEKKPSSNREELQNALRYLEHQAAEYDENDILESRHVLEEFHFRPTVGHIKKLLKRAVSNHYKAIEDDNEDVMIHAYCLSLFEKDYNVEILENPAGVLSWNYPLKMIIPTSEKNPETENVDPESSCEVESLAPSPGSTGHKSPVKRQYSVDTSSPIKMKSSPTKSPVKTKPMGARPKQTEISPSKSARYSGSATQMKSDREKVKKKIGELQLPPRRRRTVRVVYAAEQGLTRLVMSDEYEAYSNMARQAAVARCRNRFPVPVILCNGKYICRSGTLAVRKAVAFGALTRPSTSVGQDEYEGLFSYIWDGIKNVAEKSKRTVVNVINSLKVLLSTSMDDIKDRDVKVLTCLEVRYICDLMVENRKIHTGIRVSSSEKINLQKYGIFTNLKIPYPGCEFFKKYHLAGRKARGLKFDWTAPEVESSIGIIKRDTLPLNDVDWENYMEWDVIFQTQVYLRLILHFLFEGDGGMLVHCISGWDRTPLFISLLRLSLWAEGVIHRSLNHIEITYLTLAYDWYLFGHDLPTRIKKKEEILHFCFNVLPLMSVNYFSSQNIPPVEDITESETFEVLNELHTHRHDNQSKLYKIKDLVLGFYEEIVKME